MANEPILTLVGNLTADPELRYTQAGVAVANFTIASTPRSFNKQTNEWEDGEALFIRCSVWKEYAENVSATLTKGMQVIAQGRMRMRSYETKEGEKRTSLELEVDSIGPDLRFAVASVTRHTANRTQQQNRANQHAGAAPRNTDQYADESPF